MNDLIEQLKKLNETIEQINQLTEDVNFELDKITRSYKVESQEEKDGERIFEMERGN